jgi:hypothetical protein
MILTGHQPNYLPYAGFFHKVALADRFVIVDDVQFVKRGTFGWMHRNRVRTESPEGWSWLSVPVLSKGKFTQTIREARIDNSTPWARTHWRTLEWNYRRAPHWGAYAEDFRAMYERPWEGFADLTCAFIELLLRLLGIRTPVSLQSALGVKGESTGLIVELCRATGAETYLSGAHGRDYLDPAVLAAAGVKVDFQDFSRPPYPQAKPGPFVPDLSVVDLLFNVGPDSLRWILGDRAA